MHADDFGVYSLLRVDRISTDKIFSDTLHYTLYRRDLAFIPFEASTSLQVLLACEPTKVPAKTARDLIKLLQRKLP